MASEIAILEADVAREKGRLEALKMAAAGTSGGEGEGSDIPPHGDSIT